MTKISLIGAGQIGGTLAHLIGTKELVTATEIATAMSLNNWPASKFIIKNGIF